jgi:hypothetical protein
VERDVPIALSGIGSLSKSALGKALFRPLCYHHGCGTEIIGARKPAAGKPGSGCTTRSRPKQAAAVQ